MEALHNILQDLHPCPWLITAAKSVESQADSQNGLLPDIERAIQLELVLAGVVGSHPEDLCPATHENQSPTLAWANLVAAASSH